MTTAHSPSPSSPAAAPYLYVLRIFYYYPSSYLPSNLLSPAPHLSSSSCLRPDCPLVLLWCTGRQRGPRAGVVQVRARRGQWQAWLCASPRLQWT